jgi:hypothetical protein
VTIKSSSASMAREPGRQVQCVVSLAIHRDSYCFA